MALCASRSCVAGCCSVLQFNSLLLCVTSSGAARRYCMRFMVVACHAAAPGTEGARAHLPRDAVICLTSLGNCMHFMVVACHELRGFQQKGGKQFKLCSLSWHLTPSSGAHVTNKRMHNQIGKERKTVRMCTLHLFMTQHNTYIYTYIDVCVYRYIDM